MRMRTCERSCVSCVLKAKMRGRQNRLLRFPTEATMFSTQNNLSLTTATKGRLGSVCITLAASLDSTVAGLNRKHEQFEAHDSGRQQGI